MVVYKQQDIPINENPNKLNYFTDCTDHATTRY